MSLVLKENLIEEFKAIEKPYSGMPLDLHIILKVINDTPSLSPCCEECRYLEVLNDSTCYAKCTHRYINTIFKPFELDTRTHFCSLGEKK